MFMVRSLQYQTDIEVTLPCPFDLLLVIRWYKRWIRDLSLFGGIGFNFFFLNVMFRIFFVDALILHFFRQCLAGDQDVDKILAIS
ncbi:hypothetical protein SAMN05661012_03959 [Chitinophaga sancti]|uniref:Uncharacterized protein n=1 Tax=Chitinophaga sancti TaxID=1004 RepID=A0A1K1RL95_9BACT|nr:hypothetical protein SAMN05661012_03959 [Chitinophaga sancti]